MLSDKEMREQGPPSTYDWTMLSNPCWRKFYWFWRGLDYASTPAYFIFGQVWQIMLDHWYSPQVTIDWSPDQIKEHVERAIEAGRTAWTESGCLGYKNDTMENAEALFRLYTDAYTIEPYRVIGVEKGWVWPLTGTPHMLGGSLDTYIEWDYLGYLIQENKTSGVYLGDNYIGQWKHSGQVSIYIWYLTQLKGEEVHGALMNMACKRIPKTKASDGQFARDLQTRSSFQLDQFIEEQVLLKIQDFEREWDRWVWPRTGYQVDCAGGIGKAPCLYRPLCLLEAPLEDIDPTRYEGYSWRPEQWAPWERD